MTVPLEIAGYILQHLEPHQLFITATVSCAWSQLSLDCLYRNIYIRTRHQWLRFLTTLHTLNLANREAVRAIRIKGRVLKREVLHLDPDLAIIGRLCPRLEEFAIEMPDDAIAPAFHSGTRLQAVTSFGHVNLPLFPFMRCIGAYLIKPAFDRYSAVFDQLTKLALTTHQVVSQKNQQELPRLPAMFPALQTLDVNKDPSTTSLDASGLVWLLHHCPCLHHLSMQDFCLDNPNLASAPPVQTSIEYMALNNIEIKTSEWFPLFSSMLPALSLLYLDLNFKFGMGLEGMVEGISDWIIRSRSLTSLRIRQLVEASTVTGVLERLMEATSIGSWDCRLKHFALNGEPLYKIKSAGRLLECDSNALLSSLDSLQLNLTTFYDLLHPYRRMDENDLSCDQLPVFPPCNIASSTLANLTTLCLRKNGGKIKTSLTWLMQLCPKLCSAALSGLIVQLDACQLHHPAPTSVNTGLTDLTLEDCTVIQADAFFSFLQNDLSRLSSLTLAGVSLLGLHSELALDFGDRRMKLLTFASINTKDDAFTSLCLEEAQHFGKWTWFSTPTHTKRGQLLYPSNREYPFHVRCGLADQVLFYKSWVDYIL
ncbi:hypothetical protein DM01DRAFT_1385922 [Hesseltinella vesiculosa]|uniref:F-box domain-containing protein n=1 Tax=Hesseltinella vesiculosa TaxID=101127 RepID=A0A1X2G7Q7_9FUNG|nr:hypothetical protein DM01DRAFT_1385922 [Hesseltinella vesiculosa]